MYLEAASKVRVSLSAEVCCSAYARLHMQQAQGLVFRVEGLILRAYSD